MPCWPCLPEKKAARNKEGEVHPSNIILSPLKRAHLSSLVSTPFSWLTQQKWGHVCGMVNLEEVSKA